VTGLLFAQSSTTDANLAPLVRRLVRGGLGTPPGSAIQIVLLLIVWLVVLAGVSLLLQRDWRKWLRGLADIRGHYEQLGAGLEILRRNKRPLWVLLAAAVFGWTGWSMRVWDEPTSKGDWEAMLALHENRAGSFAAAHSLTAAINPLRDLASLGDLLPLVLAACVLLFARTAEMAQHLRRKTRATENVGLKRRVGTIWVGLIILLAYRVLVFVVDPVAAPMADCMYINALILPALLLAADGLLLSWVLTEFGRGVLGHFDWEADDSVAFVRGIPAALFACACINPGRYVLLGCAIWEDQFSQTTIWPATRWAPILWGCTISQVIGLAWFALPAVLAVTRHSGLFAALRAFVTLLRQAGGKVIGLTVLAIVLNLLALLPFYWVFGSMQPETWSLLGAASYGHYATLLVGIILLAGTTQLAYQELGVAMDEGPIPTLLKAPADPMAQPIGS